MTWWNPFESGRESDTDRGRAMMIAFHNFSTLKYPKNYSLTLDGLYSLYPYGFAAEIGNIAANANASDSTLRDAGELLSKTVQGIPPRDRAAWIAAIDKANESYFHQGLDFVESIPSAIASGISSGYHETVDAAKTVLSDAGDVVTTPLKSVVGGLSTPLLVVAGVGLLAIFVAGKSGALRIEKTGVVP